MTPLHVAAKKGESIEVVKYLICKGADINVKDDNRVSVFLILDIQANTNMRDHR